MIDVLIIAGGAMLRLRSHGRVFAFVLDMAAAERWSRRLPPHAGQAVRLE